MLTVITKSRLGTQAVGANLAEAARGGEVFLLVGDLGAGKTTLVQGVAKALGIKQRITSPTFVLMKVYEIKRNKEKVSAARLSSKRKTGRTAITKMVHIDAYRGLDLPSLAAIGALEYFGQSDTICFVEWGGDLARYLRRRKIVCRIVKIENLSENKREIRVS